MNICKIVKITPDGKQWGEAPNGPYYPFYIVFADGTAGQANAKNNPPAYKVGDEVGYEVTGSTPRGVPKLKIDRKADPSKCRNTTPRDDNPDLEAAVLKANKETDMANRDYERFAQSAHKQPIPANPSHSTGISQSGAAPVRLNGQMVGGALARAVDIWIATRPQEPAMWGNDDAMAIEVIVRDLVAIQQRIENGETPAEQSPF